MDITFLESDHNVPLTDDQQVYIWILCIILLILICITFAGAAYVTSVFLYELKVKRLLIIAYYSTVLVASITKILTYGWCVVFPYHQVDATIFEDSNSFFAIFFRIQKLLGIMCSLVVYLTL